MCFSKLPANNKTNKIMFHVIRSKSLCLFFEQRIVKVEYNLRMLICNNKACDFYIINPSELYIRDYRDLLFSIYYIICTLVYKVIKIWLYQMGMQRVFLGLENTCWKCTNIFSFIVIKLLFMRVLTINFIDILYPSFTLTWNFLLCFPCLDLIKAAHIFGNNFGLFGRNIIQFDYFLDVWKIIFYPFIVEIFHIEGEL